MSARPPHLRAGPDGTVIVTDDNGKFPRCHQGADWIHDAFLCYPKMKILPPNEVTTYQSARSDAGPPAVGLSVSKTKRGDALSTEANLPRSAETRADIPRQCEKFVEKKEKPWPKGSRVVIEVPAKERP